MSRVGVSTKPHSQDKRPWLILSKTEALALAQAVIDTWPESMRSAVLQRALHQVDVQVRWIEGRNDGVFPSPHSAIRREKEQEDEYGSAA